MISNKKSFLAAFVLCAMVSPVQAQEQTALQLAMAQNPVPCGGNIVRAQFATNSEGQRIVRVTCRARGLFGGAAAAGGAGAAGAAAAGATATNIVPLIGALGPAVGVASFGAVLAAANAGSSTPDTQ